MINTRKDNYTILNIEDHISTDPNSVVDFVFAHLRPEQISYWRHELKKNIITYSNPCATPSIYDQKAYCHVIYDMVMRYWIEKYYPWVYIWILFKAAVFCGLSLGFRGGPNYANKHIQDLFNQAKMNKENICL